MPLRGNAAAPAVVVGAFAVLGALAGALMDGYLESADGLLYDLSLPLASPAKPAGESGVVVVAVDAASLESEQLQRVPRVFFGPYYADLVNALFGADAKAVGFDIVFNYAAGRFPAIERGYDRAFLAALAAHRDRIVLARTAQTTVAPPFAAAVFDPLRDGAGDPAAIAYAELAPSADGVQRWVHATVTASDGTRLPTMAARLAAIAGATEPAAPFLLAPSAPLETIPTYALADVLTCARTDPAALRASFAGKVVLVGSNLPEEDRKRASDRFFRRTAGAGEAPKEGRCALRPLPPTDDLLHTLPGVHIHAAAVGAMLAGPRVQPLARWVRIATAALAAAGGAAAALFLAPVVAVTAVVLGAAILFGISTLAIGTNAWLPVALPMTLLAISAIATQAGRFVFVERRRRRVEQAFGRYLAPALVDRLASAVDELRLGGEMREVTVMFADLSGFTAASDALPPQSLMAVTNRYFEAIVAAVDAQAGYVDKYVGDAVMALWGAPVAVADSARHAADCALIVQQRVAKLARAAGDTPAAFRVRIAIASGPAIVGNVGAPRRYNYTALGSTVNLAARLEATAKDYGVDILVDRATRDVLQPRYLLCEIDEVQLKGKAAPLPVYALIAAMNKATAEQRDAAAQFEQARAALRRGERDAAEQAFHALSTGGSGLAAAAGRLRNAIAAGTRSSGTPS